MSDDHLVQLLSLVPKCGGLTPAKSPTCAGTQTTEDPRHGSCLCPTGPAHVQRLDKFLVQLGKKDKTIKAADLVDLKMVKDVTLVDRDKEGLVEADWKHAWENTQTLEECAKVMGLEAPPALICKYFRVDFAGNVVSLLAIADSAGDWQRDHYFPLARGGLNIPENLWAVSKAANNSKRAKIVHFAHFNKLKMGVQAVQFFYGLNRGAMYFGVPILDLVVGFGLEEAGKTPPRRDFHDPLGVDAKGALVEIQAFMAELKKPTPAKPVTTIKMVEKKEPEFSAELTQVMSKWVRAQVADKRQLKALKAHVDKFLTLAEHDEAHFSANFFLAEFAYFKNTDQATDLWKTLEKLLRAELATRKSSTAVSVVKKPE